MIVLMFFSYKYLRVGKSYLYKKLKVCDRLLIGGGHLISDIDLNFPLKLFLLIKVAEKLQIETMFVAVGVSNKWNWLSKWLIKRVLTSKAVIKISVRDSLSKSNLSTYFNIEHCDILPDPALMSALTYPHESTGNKGKRRLLGIGITDIRGLNYSSDIVNKMSKNDFDFISSIVKKSHKLGIDVAFYTNGASEDEAFMNRYISPKFSEQSLVYKSIERPKSPEELVRTISQFDFVIAYHLHANIIASCFNIPYFAVNWDNKVSSFFRSQGSEYFAYNTLQDLDTHHDEIISILNQKLVLDVDTIEDNYKTFIGI